MSKIRRLLIKGIRNFSDGEDNEIEFKCPITLILGENGTGKTTIIECLKFATSGDFPPNSDKGKSFVTDPQIASSSLTRAAIKLEFENKKGQIMTTYRSLELKRTASSMSICSTDNTLSLYNKEVKQFVNVSNRCADTNAMLIDMMGVSKAILNYVIFCHQDDSFWPLEGGKELKAKMDEIFGTAHFNKALETTRNIHKSYTAKVKVLKNDKQNLKMMVDEVEMKKQKLEGDKARLAKLVDEMNDIDSKIEPLDKKLEDIDHSIALYDKKIKELNDKRMEYEISEKEISYLESNIDDIFEGSDEELQKKIDLFETNFNDKSSEITEEQEKLENGHSIEKEIVKSLNEQKVLVGTYEQKSKDNLVRITTRNELLLKALKNWNINIHNSDINETEAIKLMEKLSEKLSNFENETEQVRIKREREEKLMQNDIDLLISNSSSVRSELNLKEQECESIQQELQTIRKHIVNAGTATNRLKDSELKLEEASEEYETILNQINDDAVKKEIEDLTKLERENEQLVKQLDKEITSLNRQSALQSEIDIYESNLKNKQDQLEAICKKHNQSLSIILGTNDVPMQKLRSRVESMQQKMIQVKRNVTRNIETVRQQITSLETTLKLKEKDLDKNVTEIEADKLKVSQFCSYDNYDEALKLQATKLKSLRNQKSFYAYQRIAYEKYLGELTDKNPCCPLCSRDFKAENEVQKFKKSMQIQMDRQPDTVKSCEAELQKEEMKYDAMLQLKPTVSKILKFENYSFKQLTKQIEENKEQMKNVEEKMSKLSESLLDVEEKLNMCETVMIEIALWDQCIDEIEKINRKIKALKQSLQYKVESSRSLEAVEAERESCHEKISACRENKEKLQSQLENYYNKKHQVWENKKSLEEKVLNIRSEMQKVNQLREKEKELTLKMSTLNESILALRDKYLTEDEKLISGNEKLQNFKTESRKLQEENKGIVCREQQIAFKLSSYQKEIDEFLKLEIESKLKKCKETIECLNQTLNDTKIKNARIAKTLQKLQSDFATHERLKKQLEDNVDLRMKKGMNEMLQKQYSLIQEDVDSMNYDELISEKNQLNRKKYKYFQKRHEAKGVKDEMDRAIAKLQIELKKDDYTKSINNYKSTCAEIVVTEKILDDLQLYMQGMDQAVSDYHKDRMNAVNEIMSKMWTAVYKGTDTKGIQIKTESTGKMDSLRRQFNYKLVQTKHDVEMEMKGRCSAGQKVLASIIIRMALAEAFCGNCGVLALDEPTTNLDVHNAKSLAHALLKIVECRSKYQKNFQLILITHDEEFLRILAKLDPNNSFYKLQRDDRNGRTVISQHIVDHETGSND